MGETHRIKLLTLNDPEGIEQGTAS